MKPRYALTIALLITGCGQTDSGLMSEWETAAAAAAEESPQPAKRPGSVAEGLGINVGSEPVAAAADPPQPAAQPATAKTVPVTKREAKLVDKQKAMAENPSLVEVENKISASDPLTAVSQSYFTIGSRAKVHAMQYNLRIQKEIDGRWPSFEEFEKSFKQSGASLNALYPWQMYAYDAETGGISILEDRAEKKRQYEAAGRDYPHDD